jgi:hypothetical protein
LSLRYKLFTHGHGLRIIFAANREYDGMDTPPTPATAVRLHGRRRILVLYDHHWLHVKTIADYLAAFHRYSESVVCYATSFGHCRFDLDSFDAVVVHYSVKVCYPGHLSPSFERALRKARRLKVLFLQDEYEATDANRAAIRDLGVRLVFTCVPPESIEKVYPRADFPGVEFVHVLTGYVPLDATGAVQPPMRQRATLIGYRGRSLGFWYGDLGQEKRLIGQRMRAICDAHGLRTDIEWDEKSRIYGDDWLRFLAGCKATLGTESGANVFDFDGGLTIAIQRELLRNPAVGYDEIRARYLSGVEGSIVMNQISPKVFEAIACRTALILFEGRYSGVLEPEKHFIPLRKDFSNIDNVLQRLQDDDYLEALAARAYDDVVGSDRHSYRALVRVFDDALLRQWSSGAFPAPATGPWLPLPPCDALPGFRASYARAFRAPWLKRAWYSLPPWLRASLRPLVSRRRWKDRWVRMPRLVRTSLRPVLERVRWLLKQAA